MKELRTKSDRELQVLLSETEQRLFKGRMELATRTLKDQTELRRARVLIAQLKTLMREQELATTATQEAPDA